MIHQYKLCGYNIVLDVCSGAVHAVDDIAYEIITRYEGNTREGVLDQTAALFPDVPRSELEECYDQVAGLERAGSYWPRLSHSFRRTWARQSSSSWGWSRMPPAMYRSMPS